jgi:hypothetical protein
MDKHIPKQQKTHFIFAMAEKLEAAPADMLAADVMLVFTSFFIPYPQCAQCHSAKA